MSSEFLFVIPDGWTQIDLAGQASLSYEAAASMCNETNWISLTDALRAMSLIGADQTVYAARVFNNEVLVVQLV